MSPDKLYTAQHPHRLLLDGDASLFLRLATAQDSEQLYKLVHENREHLGKYQRWARDINFEQMHEAVQASVQRIAQDSWLQYRIMVPQPASEHRMVGTVTLFGRDLLSSSAVLGYWLAESEQGKSYARKSIQRLLQYAANNWQLKKVYIQIEDENERAAGLARRLGATPQNDFVQESFGDESFALRRWELVLST